MSEGDKKGRNLKMTTRKFTDHKYAQAQINTYPDGSQALQSYSTIVVEIDPEGWLKVNGLFSMTTIRHIGWFAKLIGTDYHTLKGLMLDHKDMNIHTGEVVDWE